MSKDGTKLNLVVMYYGRFQPPHVGHMGVYSHLVNKFGIKNVYIGTSNKTDKEKSPLSFQWKQKLLRQLNVPSKHIIQVKKTYNPTEIGNSLGFDPENTVFIVAIGKKDASRLGGPYFKPYKKGEKFSSMMDHGYYYIVKKDSETKLGGTVLTSTILRNLLRRDDLDKNDYTFLKTAMNASKSSIDTVKPLFEHRLLFEGGMGGHMNNLYDDLNLKFTEFEQIIKDSLSGELNKEEIREKTDGQNLFASYIDGEVRFSRNKSQIKNSGANSLGQKEIASKWGKTSPKVAEAFNGAFDALTKAFNKLSKPDLDEIFQNGRNWINMEIIWETNVNIFNYGESQVVFHGLEIVDDSGIKTGVDQKLTTKLFGLIEKLDNKDDVPVKVPPFVKLKGNEDYSKKSKYFISKLDKFRSKQKVGKGATLGQWYEKYFDKKLKEIENKFKSKINPQSRKKLIARFAWNNNAAYKLNDAKKEIGDALLYAEISKLAKSIDKEYDKAREPLVLMLMEFGLEVLKNLESYLSINPDETIVKLRKDISSKISTVSGSKNPDYIKKMQDSIKRLKSVGGLDNIVPTEGIIFSWNDKLYKITGSFAELSKLLAIGRY